MPNQERASLDYKNCVTNGVSARRLFMHPMKGTTNAV